MVNYDNLLEHAGVFEVISKYRSGILFFQYDDPLIYAFTSAFKILPDAGEPGN